ncbi:MAG: energy transducer TonB [Calditrichia bacterium]
MKNKRTQWIDDRRIFLVTLLFTLTAFVLLFYFIPVFNTLQPNSEQNPQIPLQIRGIPEIPATAHRKPPPQKPLLPIAGPATTDEFPPEFTEETSLSSKDVSDTVFYSSQIKPVNTTPARLVLESYPNPAGTSCGGQVQLLLLINEDGQVASIQVLQNTTASKRCLQLALQAAKSSRWMPAQWNDRPVESWIKKNYKFEPD